MTDRLAAARAKLIDYVVLDDGPGLKSAKTRQKDKINSNENSVIIRNRAFIIFRGHLFLINYNKKVYLKFISNRLWRKKRIFTKNHSLAAQ